MPPPGGGAPRNIHGPWRAGIVSGMKQAGPESRQCTVGARLRSSSAAVAGLALLAAGFVPAKSSGEPVSGTAGHQLLIGVLAHDRGFTSDDHEDGVDPNIEIRFRPLDGPLGRKIGSPRPHLGVTPNFSGDTSAAYGGITYNVPLPGRLFIDLGGGLAVHDGPLHKKDVERCKTESDCGFGSRVLLHGSFDLGVELRGGRSISFYFDHMSQGELFADENEGIEHIGVRYGFGF